MRPHERDEDRFSVGHSPVTRWSHQALRTGQSMTRWPSGAWTHQVVFPPPRLPVDPSDRRCSLRGCPDTAEKGIGMCSLSGGGWT